MSTELLDHPVNDTSYEDSFVIPDKTERARDATSHAAAALEQMQKVNRESRLSTRFLAGAEKFESWLDVKAKNAAQASRDKSEEKDRGEKSANRRAWARETFVKSGFHLGVGATALGLTIATGPGTMIVAGAFAARTGLRLTRNIHRSAEMVEDDEGNKELRFNKLTKLTTESDKLRHKALIGVANAIQAPERWATNVTRSRKEEVSDTRELASRAFGATIGSAAMFGFGRLAARPLVHLAENHAAQALKFAENKIVPEAEAQSTTGGAPSSLGDLDPLKGNSFNRLFSANGSDTTLKDTPPVPTGGAEAPGEGAIDPTSGHVDTDKTYNRGEAHTRNRQVTEGLFDGTERDAKETDAHVLHKAENNPELMAEVLEVHESGNVNFSVDDVNHDAASYTDGAKYGEYNATGEKAVDKLERTWANGKEGKILSQSQAQKMLKDYNLINHGTRNGAGANDRVFAAGKFDYRPDLGDKIYAKELGNGRTVFFKVNEQNPSRDCLNCLTLEKKPLVVHTPPQSHITKTPPQHYETPAPRHHETPVPKETPQPKETLPPETHPPVTQPPHETPPPKETPPPETQPPVTQPPVTQPPVTQPPVTKGPTQGTGNGTPGVEDPSGNGNTSPQASTGGEPAGPVNGVTPEQASGSGNDHTPTPETVPPSTPAPTPIPAAGGSGGNNTDTGPPQN